MLYARDGHAPIVHPTARVAPSAQIVGDVVIGPECFVGHQVVIESGGPPVVLDSRVAVFAGAVIRSVGGTSRSAPNISSTPGIGSSFSTQRQLRSEM